MGHPNSSLPGSSAATAKKIPPSAATLKRRKILEETRQMLGYITGFFCLQKKSRKVYYAGLNSRCFELHNSEKDFQRIKRPRYIFDLATVFNVNRQEDSKWKQAIMIMTPDDAFIFAAAKDDPNHYTTSDWYHLLMMCSISARAQHLGRPVMIGEFFDYCVDIVITDRPRLRGSQLSIFDDTPEFKNLCLQCPRMAFQRYRLGLYTHSIVLVEAGNVPAMYDHPVSCIPPFKIGTFHEIPRQMVASFGHQDKYFILRCGKFEKYNMVEIWMKCQSEYFAKSLWTTFSTIIETESIKRKADPFFSNKSMVNVSPSPRNPPPSPPQNPKPPPPQDPPGPSSPTPPQDPPSPQNPQPPPPPPPPSHPANSLPPSPIPPATSPTPSAVSPPPFASPMLPLIPGSSASPMLTSRSSNYAKSVDHNSLGRDRTLSVASNPVPRAHTVGSQAPSSTSWLSKFKNFNKIEKSTLTQAEAPVESQEEGMPSVREWARFRASLATESTGEDETEDSGGTLKFAQPDDYAPSQNYRRFHNDRLVQSFLESASVAERDTVEDSFEEVNHHRGSFSSCASDTSVQLRQRMLTAGSDSGKSEGFECVNAPHDSTSTTHSEHAESDASKNESDSDLNVSSAVSLAAISIDDAPAYISDSNDSCYSSITANNQGYLNPRTLSFTAPLGFIKSKEEMEKVKEIEKSKDEKQQIVEEYEVMTPGQFEELTSEPAKVDSKTCVTVLSNSEIICVGEDAESSMAHRIGGENCLLQPKEDLRKRAFSLGSKSWIMKPFRKRSHHGSSSKASSYGGDFECESVASQPLSTSRQPSMQSFTSSIHGRSDSIDSSVSHPSSRHSGSSARRPNDLVPVNFSPTPSNLSMNRRYGSNNSVESPMRSRTSSTARSAKTSIIPPNLVEETEDGESTAGAGSHRHETFMHEVQCYIMPTDVDIFQALQRDNLSLHSKDNSSISHFETIDEHAVPTTTTASSSRAPSRHSRLSMEPSSPMERTKGIPDELRVPKASMPVDDVAYALVQPPAPTRKVSMPAPTIRKTQKEAMRKCASQDKHQESVLDD